MMVDLDVNAWCETVYRLQQEVQDAPAVDEVSRLDYGALALAVSALYKIVQRKRGAADHKQPPFLTRGDFG